MTLRRRLLLSNAALALLVAVVFVVLLVAVLSLRRAGERSEHSATVIGAVVSAEKSVLDLETGARGYALTGAARFLAPWEMARREVPGELARLRSLVRDNPAQKARAVVVARGVRSYLTAYSVPFVALARRDRRAAATVSRAGAGKRRVDALRRRFDTMLIAEGRLAADRRATANDRRTQAEIAVGAGLVICLLFVVAQQVAVRRWVVEPLDRLGVAARGLAGGDLSTRVAGVRGHDEVGAVATAFDEMAGSLQTSDADLRRSNAELEQFAYVASHDLAEPLRVMAGYADLLERKYRGQLDDRADRYLAGITAGSERMRQLIDDLLAYSRAGRRELQMGDVDLGALVETVRRDLAVAVEESGAELAVNGLPVVHGDATQLRIVLQNLVGNAIKFRARGRPPRIDIEAVPEDGVWRIAVADNGIGIDARHADRVFRMFQRLHTRDEYPGTGIGLALCQRVVERHGGQIRADPRDGGGTVITFTLPR